MPGGMRRRRAQVCKLSRKRRTGWRRSSTICSTPAASRRGLKFDFADVNLENLLRKVADAYRTQTERHRILVEFDGPLPPIWGDEERLRQVFTNLLNNAIRVFARRRRHSHRRLAAGRAGAGRRSGGQRTRRGAGRPAGSWSAGTTSSSAWPTRASASRSRACPTSSTATIGSTARCVARPPAQGWASFWRAPSSRRTAAASGRPASRARARPSSWRCPSGRHRLRGATMTNKAVQNLPHDQLVNAYWVVPGRLLAGPYPSAPDPINAQKQVAALLDLGVDYIVDPDRAGRVRSAQLPGRSCWRQAGTRGGTIIAPQLVNPRHVRPHGEQMRHAGRHRRRAGGRAHGLRIAMAGLVAPAPWWAATWCATEQKAATRRWPRSPTCGATSASRTGTRRRRANSATWCWRGNTRAPRAIDSGPAVRVA